MNRPKALFVTDPLCSWCWGTLPEVLAVRERLAGVIDFDLIMGGLQVGSLEGLAGYQGQQLQHLWQEVGNVTGQHFSGVIPEGFVYHSEIPCRAVEIARHEKNAPPWEFFASLQSAFYRDGRNISGAAVLAELLGLSAQVLATRLQDPALIEATRANFRLKDALSANALPSVYLDTGEGMKLLCGGYVTRDFLEQDLRARLQAV